jgi:molybdopterin-guanine dinucleotide biosynthesis protein A
MSPPLYGLVLAGGSSRRMGEHTAAPAYRGRPQLAHLFDLLAPRVSRCFVSLRPDQVEDPLRAAFPGIVDRLGPIGPAAGLLAAHEAYPDAAWLAVACDLPALDEATLDTLIAARDPSRGAVAYRSEHDGLPEPLCAIWEPEKLDELRDRIAEGKSCPRKALLSSAILILSPRTQGALDNANTPEERAAIGRRLGHG